MLSEMQQMIVEKEAELARMRQSATDAARRQEEEARDNLLRALEAAELEVLAVQEEGQRAVAAAVQQVEKDAEAGIARAKAEMEQAMQRREEEIFDAAGAKIEGEWALREAHLREEFQAVLGAELDDQHGALTAHYEAIVKEKDEALKVQEEATKQQLSGIEAERKRQVESMQQKAEQVAQDVWDEARDKFGAAADEEIAHALAMAEEHCLARDEQISLLLEERSELQKLISEKETLLKENVRDLSRMEKALEDAKSDARSHRDKEAAKLSEEVICLMKDNEQLQQALHATEDEYKLIEDELARRAVEQKALETKCAEQKEAAGTFDSEKKRFQSRNNELSACKELLERQLSDAKSENQELATNVEVLEKKRSELEQTMDKMSNEIAMLSNKVDGLERLNRDIETKHHEAVAQVGSLKHERREYAREVEDTLKRKDRLLAETLESLNNGSKSRAEPVVVHLHGNKHDSANLPSGNERLAGECNNLRSKVLQLQRENFRLESELMNARSRHTASSSNAGVSDEALLQENNSLKTVVTMMRKEMETAATDKDASDKASLPSETIIEQQLAQCRSYLDLLLTKRTASDGHGFRNDEVAFLRSKYQELHRAADELRDENARLHRQCNANAGRNDYDGPTLREQELIQRLEEATDEVEALLDENEKLVKLSNELKYELRLTNGVADVREPPPGQRHTRDRRSNAQAEEQTMLDVVLNDQSRSCDSESHESEVACIGRKPPLTSAANSRPSKTTYGSRPRTASDRATASQRESLKRMISRKKKEISVEKVAIRNWSVKDPPSNPFFKR